MDKQLRKVRLIMAKADSVRQHLACDGWGQAQISACLANLLPNDNAQPRRHSQQELLPRIKALLRSHDAEERLTDFLVALDSLDSRLRTAAEASPKVSSAPTPKEKAPERQLQPMPRPLMKPRVSGFAHRLPAPSATSRIHLAPSAPSTPVGSSSQIDTFLSESLARAKLLKCYLEQKIQLTEAHSQHISTLNRIQRLSEIAFESY